MTYRSLIPRLHDEASSTSWLDELASRASFTSQLVKLASSCKRGINGIASSCLSSYFNRIAAVTIDRDSGRIPPVVRQCRPSVSLQSIRTFDAFPISGTNLWNDLPPDFTSHQSSETASESLTFYILHVK